MASSLRGRDLFFTSQPLSITDVQTIGAHTPTRSLTFADTPIGDAHVRELRGLINLTRLTMHGSQITDAALQDLAALPKLKHLDIARSNITGAGLVHFKGHPSLNSLSLEETNITDQALPLAADIPNLEGLNLRETQTTIVGLMPLVKLKRLSVWPSQYMTGDEMRQFEAQQRQLARPASRRRPAAAAALAPIESTFKAFLDEMAAHERDLEAALPPPADPNAYLELVDRTLSACRAIFARHCTPAACSVDRSWATTIIYRHQKLGEIELMSAEKAYVHTEGTGSWEGQRFRYTMLMTPAGWRVHAKTAWKSGWRKDWL